MHQIAYLSLLEIRALDKVPQYFQKLSAADLSELICRLERVILYFYNMKSMIDDA